jgi:hypothetical protein
MIKRKLKFETDPLELKAELFLKRVWIFIKKESKRIIKWLFFYKPENKMDAILHIIDVLTIIYILTRLSNLP